MYHRIGFILYLEFKSKLFLHLILEYLGLTTWKRKMSYNDFNIVIRTFIFKFHLFMNNKKYRPNWKEKLNHYSIIYQFYSMFYFMACWIVREKQVVSSGQFFLEFDLCQMNFSKNVFVRKILRQKSFILNHTITYTILLYKYHLLPSNIEAKVTWAVVLHVLSLQTVIIYLIIWNKIYPNTFRWSNPILMTVLCVSTNS